MPYEFTRRQFIGAATAAAALPLIPTPAVSSGKSVQEQVMRNGWHEPTKIPRICVIDRPCHMTGMRFIYTYDYVNDSGRPILRGTYGADLGDAAAVKLELTAMKPAHILFYTCLDGDERHLGEWGKLTEYCREDCLFGVRAVLKRPDEVRDDPENEYRKVVHARWAGRLMDGTGDDFIVWANLCHEFAYGDLCRQEYGTEQWKRLKQLAIQHYAKPLVYAKDLCGLCRQRPHRWVGQAGFEDMPKICNNCHCQMCGYPPECLIEA